MTESHFTIWVCVDCLMTDSSGEPAENPDREPWNLLDREPEGSHVTMGLMREEHSCGYESDPDSSAWEECNCADDEFSWSTCDGCGSSLGGSRHACTLWTPAEIATAD